MKHLYMYVKTFSPFRPSQSQGCALEAAGRLRQLAISLGQLEKKSGRLSGCLYFGLCDDPKRNE